ncbi:MAG TPA: glycosyltransferase [Saccharofermentans sp.]|nr:glycosyltransferase [Saccharofermentans sp.]
MTEIEKEYYKRLALQEEYGGTNKPVNKITPSVSIITTTYQHAPYIRQCLDSILMQETDFPYELIIGEDGSTDGTREICIEYANKYPDKIRLFLRDRKLTQYVIKDGRTIRFNGHFARAAARGKYVAMCEGDDYWIDKKKLQKQVVVLDNTAYCMCCTNYFVLDSEKLRKVRVEETGIREFTLRDVIKRNIVGTLTTVFRSQYLSPFDAELSTLWFGDWTLWIALCLSANASICYMGECTAVYRITKSGLSNSTAPMQQYADIVTMYEVLRTRLPNEYGQVIDVGESIAKCDLAIRLAVSGHRLKATRFLLLSLHQKFSDETLSSQLKCLIAVVSPQLFAIVKRKYLSMNAK